MTNPRTYLSHDDVHVAKPGKHSTAPPVDMETGLGGVSKQKEIVVKENGGGEEYMAMSPNGTQVLIPKELYVALSDFIKTRKCPGSISIQFRSGEIVCVEAIAKKTYRNNP